MMSVYRLAITILLGISLVGVPSAPQAQTGPPENCHYFDKTGHYVCDAFLEFFQEYGGLEIFGYPMTEAFSDSTHGGLHVQYFQRARMEEHPANEPPYNMQLGLLVDELGYSYPPAPPEELPDPADPSHHYFPETQHVVSHAFLDFFRAKGGLYIFGYPRSEMVYEDGLVVQYFQRARMEWHQEGESGHQIVLGNVGEEYAERFAIPGKWTVKRPPPPRGDPSQMVPGPRPLYQVLCPLILVNSRPVRPARFPAPTPTAPASPATALNVSASVRYAISGRTGTQTVYIYVTDQQGRPVAGAEARLVVHYESGDLACVAKPTDASGFTQCSFEIVTPPVGKQVVIDVTVAYEGLTAATQASFQPWW